jgi:hypothetical protein
MGALTMLWKGPLYFVGAVTAVALFMAARTSAARVGWGADTALLLLTTLAAIHWLSQRRLKAGPKDEAPDTDESAVLFSHDGVGTRVR